MNRLFQNILVTVFPAMLGLCPAVHSQETVSDPLADRLVSYTSKAMPEKLYLHSDKDLYVAGEIIWFKLYYADGATHRPEQISAVAYTEVINDKGEPVAQAKISLREGERAGSFYLPTSLPAGYYTIRAYTSWMKNFDAGYYFEKRITVINTLNVSRTGVADTTVKADFFPEGGNLVYGLRSKVGFRIWNRNGGMSSATGYIVSSDNDTVVSFSPLRFGIGHFYFEPAKGKAYRAVIVSPGAATASTQLPEVYEQGYVMRVDEMPANRITVTVRAAWKPGEAGSASLLLLVHTKQKGVMAQKAIIAGRDSIQFRMDKNTLEAGITHITLFNDSGTPLCERLIYKHPPAAPALTVRTDQSSYGPREKIQVSLGNTSASLADLSVSVFQLDSLQEENQSTIFDYMWLRADLPAPVESPGWYFSNDPAVAAATDNLMLTHGWRRFNWQDIVAGRSPVIKFLPEVNGHIVTGILKDTRRDVPAAGINAYLSVPGNGRLGFYTAQSDQAGLIRFDVKDYYGNGRVISQPAMDADTFYNVIIQSPYSEIKTIRNYGMPSISPTQHDRLLRRSISMQSQNIYSGDSLKKFNIPVPRDTFPFYGRPDVVYKLDDYKRFPTMEEVLREYVLEIGVGVRNGAPFLKLFDPRYREFYSGNTLVLLDGVALHNGHKIFSYDPLKIKRLEIVRLPYVLGHSIFNGIASFSSIEGGFDGYDLGAGQVAVDYPGLQLQREFYSPAYTTAAQRESRVPDFRTTLYWAPNISAAANGQAMAEFYSGDIPGTYRIVVQGMNSKGELMSASGMLTIK